jgi:inner membrane protein YidH
MSKSAAPQLDASTRLAVDRTRLAHERTLMAWVRTATSLISFGFTIYKFFQFEISKEDVHRVNSAFGPRRFGMVMIVIGILSLVTAQIQDYFHRKELDRQYGPAPFSVATAVALVVGALGMVALVVTALEL